MASTRQAYFWCTCWVSYPISHSSHLSITHVKGCVSDHIEGASSKLKNKSSAQQKAPRLSHNTCSSSKPRVYELMSLGKPMDNEDLLEKILDGLGSEYQYIIDAVNGRDTPISFNELHEKLINKEITLQ